MGRTWEVLSLQEHSHASSGILCSELYLMLLAVLMFLAVSYALEGRSERNEREHSTELLSPLGMYLLPSLPTLCRRSGPRPPS